jgi:hypothetical protein
VIYVPIVIAFYASMAKCTYWSDSAVDPAPEPNVPVPARVGITFMTLTNAAFLVSKGLTVQERAGRGGAKGAGSVTCISSAGPGFASACSKVHRIGSRTLAVCRWLSAAPC